jgi:NitT/TauT family transport system substrate-binding protein
MLLAEVGRIPCRRVMCRLANFVVVGLGLFIGLACARKESAPSQVAPKSTPRKVVLQTDWFPQAEHGGFYQALAKGFYAEAGLDVDIWSGGPGAGIKLKVAKGDADFGMSRSDDLMIAGSRDMPLVMVAATMQHDPMALMVHAASPVKTFKDLQGRVVIGNVALAYMPFLEQKFGITFEKRQNSYGLGEFLANPDVIQQCVVTNEPFFVEQQGRTVRTLPLASAGYDCYHTIFCRRQLIATSPEVVRAFVHASIRGWRDYMENDPAPADALILKRNPQTTSELLRFSRREMIARQLVTGDRAKGEDIGRLSPERLSSQMETLLALKIMEHPVAVAKVATTAFLPGAP